MPKPPPSDDDLIRPVDEASTAFIKGIVARGQAAKAGKSGVLPPGATHEIVGENEHGVPILRRKRFSSI